VAQGQAAARQDQPGVAVGYGHGHAGGDECPAAPGGQADIVASDQVGAGIPRAGIGRQRQVRIKADDRDLEHGLNATGRR
jgi:hypothetical protein